MQESQRPVPSEFCVGAVVVAPGRIREGMAGMIPVADRTLARAQHTELEQCHHVPVDPHVMGCEMTHNGAFQMPQFTCWIIDSAIVDNRRIDGLHGCGAERPSAVEAPSKRGNPAIRVRVRYEPSQSFLR